jgi:anti-sigma factor RsiW
MACREYESRWEDYLDGRLDEAAREELDAHLSRCPGCREALEAARASSWLLRSVLEPAPEPRLGFWTRVEAGIRAAETGEKDFWGSLEKLAWRLSWAATLAVALMAGYLVTFDVGAGGGSALGQTEIRELMPEPTPQPVSKDDVLLILAANGR